ncbi:MAG: hypothetical protein BWX97_00517 [Firmicutes bacterium ADurb.Bin146]|nr:MAG: hypothetical protein BWX97_00517 [Firmicutes bacterium ADurb.Bin146]
MPQYTSVSPEDEVRIVVELSEKSAIEMAKDAGVTLRQANKFSSKVSVKQKSVIDGVKAIGKVVSGGTNTVVKINLSFDIL